MDPVARRPEDVERLPRLTVVDRAKHRDENGPSQNWAANGALRKILPRRSASRISARVRSQDRYAGPAFAARAQWPGESSGSPHRGLRINQVHAAGCDG